MSTEVKSYAPHQLRVVKEQSELNERIEALETFIFSSSTSIFSTLDPRQQSLLEQQLDTMKAYEHILALRISYF